MGADGAGPPTWPPVVVCLLGGFRVLVEGRALPVRHGGKTEQLFNSLATRHGYQASRETLLGILWPDTAPERAGQSLSTLLHTLRRQLAGSLRGASPVIHTAGLYSLNTAAGVTVDLAEFESAMTTARQHARRGERDLAAEAFAKTIALYRGDLAGDDARSAIERERLRALFLAALGWLAAHFLEQGELDQAQTYAAVLLQVDPCHEEAHRVLMRCQVRSGARSQALRQYALCRGTLRAELGIAPEPATEDLAARIRTNPASV